MARYSRASASEMLINESMNDYYKTLSVFDELPAQLVSINKSRDAITSNYVTRLQKLEAQIKDFQNIKFPDLKLPKLRKKKKKKGARSAMRPNKLTPERIINIPASLRPSPMPEFRLPNIDKERLGPGCYFSNAREVLPGSYIPRGSRFENSIEEQLKFLDKKKYNSDNYEMFVSIEKRNKDLDQFMPESKERNFKEKAKERDIRLKIQQKTKEILEEYDQRTKEERYFEKVSKKEWKLKLQELGGLARVLYNMIGILEISSLIRGRLTNKLVIFIQNLRKRSHRHLSCIYYICIFIGRIRRLIFKRRLSNLIKSVNNFFPRINNWVRGRVKRHTSIVNYAIEKPMLSKDLFELMVQYMRRILLIQRKARSYLAVKHARFKVLGKKLNLLMSKTFKRSISFKNQVRTPGPAYKEMIADFMQKYCIQQIQQFIVRIQAYHEDVKMASDEYDEYLKENFVDMLLYGKVLEDSPRKVYKPVLKIFSDHEALNQVIRKANMRLNGLTRVQHKLKNKSRALTFIRSSSTSINN